MGYRRRQERVAGGDGADRRDQLLRHVEQTFAVTARTGLDLDKQVELSSIVDDYVFGHAMRAYHGARFGGGEPSEQRLDALVAYLTEQLATGEYPHLQAIVGDDPATAFVRVGHLTSDEERFERGLQLLLDGLEAWVNASRATGPASGS